MNVTEFKQQYNVSDSRFKRARQKIEDEVGYKVVERRGSNTWFILDLPAFKRELNLTEPVVAVKPPTNTGSGIVPFQSALAGLGDVLEGIILDDHVFDASAGQDNAAIQEVALSIKQMRAAHGELKEHNETQAFARNDGNQLFQKLKDQEMIEKGRLERQRQQALFNQGFNQG